LNPPNPPLGTPLTAASYLQRCHRLLVGCTLNASSNTGLPSISKGLVKNTKCIPQVIASFAFWPLGAAACVSTAKWLLESEM
jgi:hypothetical protein